MEFEAQVRVKNGRNLRPLWVTVSVICIVMILCMLLKLLVGDFNPSDLRAMLGSLLIMFVAMGNGRNRPRCVEKWGKVLFGAKGLVIVYETSENVEIMYADVTKLQWFEPSRRLLVYVRHTEIINVLVDVHDDAEKVKEKLQVMTGMAIEDAESDFVEEE